MGRRDLRGGAPWAQEIGMGLLGALMLALWSGPAFAQGDDADANEEAEPPAEPSEAEDESEGDGDEEVVIRTLAPNRHMDVKARSLRLTEKAAERLLEIARRFHGETGRKLVVTGGERNAARQAELMYKKLDNGEDLEKLYARDDLVRPIVAAYERGKEDRKSKKHTLRQMTKVIQSQVDQKQYVSRHLAFTAADVRSRDMSPETVSTFKSVVKAVPGVVLIDERKSAAPCFHLSM